MQLPQHPPVHASVPETNVPLAERARSLIASGVLQGCPLERVFAGYGEQHSECSLCGQRIEPTQVQYEVESARVNSSSALRFHLPCYEAWQEATFAREP
jgi:hypothetical protein